MIGVNHSKALVIDNEDGYDSDWRIVIQISLV